MPRKAATDPELLTVRGITGEWVCKDIPAVDKHLGKLQRQISTSGSSADAENLKKDFDLLLERRFFLELTAD